MSIIFVVYKFCRQQSTHSDTAEVRQREWRVRVGCQVLLSSAYGITGLRIGSDAAVPRQHRLLASEGESRDVMVIREHV